jgi:protein-tyrosine phosphatase
MSESIRNILFVCARNRIRSVAAEKLFTDSNQYKVRSRGIASDARIPLTENDLNWADVVFVMEKNHRNRIVKKFREKTTGKRIICLYIEDIYEPMEESLFTELKFKLSSYLEIPQS